MKKWDSFKHTPISGILFQIYVMYVSETSYNLLKQIYEYKKGLKKKKKKKGSINSGMVRHILETNENLILKISKLVYIHNKKLLNLILFQMTILSEV